jgi:hypothetical protein
MSYFTNVEANDNIIDYFLLPTAQMTGPRRRFSENNRAGLDAYRDETIDALMVSLAVAGLRSCYK